MHSQLTKDLFLAYAKAGTSYNMIAKKLEIGRSAVFAWRKELGLPARARGRGAPCRKQKKKATGV
jgi:transposase-like protein